MNIKAMPAMPVFFKKTQTALRHLTSGPLEAPVWALHSGEHLPQEMARFHEFNHARIKWK